MSTVTYKNQPAIHDTRGAVPLAGNSRVYTVNKVLWPKDVEDFIQTLFVGKTLHACCGMSRIGDVLLDLHADNVDIRHDAADMSNCTLLQKNPKAFDTVLCDPPYNGKFQWNHNLLSELAKVAQKRIIFQHWFIPADKYGRYKKDHAFTLKELYCWQPQTYFGRVQMISVFDKYRMVMRVKK